MTFIDPTRRGYFPDAHNAASKTATSAGAVGAAAKKPSSARQAVVQFLTQFGLQDLADWAWKTYQDAGGGDAAFEQIKLDMINQPAFKARFPAYDQLAKAGKAMSPAEMLAYEQTARQIFHDAGLPGGFYDDPTDFAQFMLNDVSAQELQSRVALAQTAVVSAPQDVRNQLEQLYGVHSGELTAYFIDPAKALPLVTKRYAAATIGGAATRTGFGQLSQAQAEQVASLGVNDTQAQEGFGQLAQSAGLFEAQVAGEQQISQDEQIAGQFGGDAAARLAFQKRQAQRKAQFAGQSGVNVTQAGVSALGEKNKAV